MALALPRGVRSHGEDIVMRSRRLALAFLALLAVACGEANPVAEDGSIVQPLPGTTIVIQPIPIDSVDVSGGSPTPGRRRVVARVRGALGGGCDYLHSIEQRRQGSTVTIDILRSGVTEGPCTAIFKGFYQE